MSAALTTNVDERQLRTTTFPIEFNTKVDTSKINIAVIQKWVSDDIARILQAEDDIVTEMVFNLLEGSHSPDIKRLQIALGGFLGNDAPSFCLELWRLCIDAQKNPQGIPQKLLEAKKTELLNEKAVEEREREEAKKRQQADRDRDRELARVRERERDERDRDRLLEDDLRVTAFAEIVLAYAEPIPTFQAEVPPTTEHPDVDHHHHTDDPVLARARRHVGANFVIPTHPRDRDRGQDRARRFPGDGDQDRVPVTTAVAVTLTAATTKAADLALLVRDYRKSPLGSSDSDSDSRSRSRSRSRPPKRRRPDESSNTRLPPNGKKLKPSSDKGDLILRGGQDRDVPSRHEHRLSRDSPAGSLSNSTTPPLRASSSPDSRRGSHVSSVEGPDGNVSSSRGQDQEVGEAL